MAEIVNFMLAKVVKLMETNHQSIDTFDGYGDQMIRAKVQIKDICARSEGFSLDSKEFSYSQKLSVNR